MPLYKIVEEYSQAVVRRVMLVSAPSLEEAKEQPHSHDVIAEGYEIDEGGEACTVEAKQIQTDGIATELVLINKLAKPA